MVRGCLVGLLGVVVGLGFIGEAADVTARHVATSKIESRIREAVPGASGVSVSIHSWPFLKVGVDGHAGHRHVGVTGVEEGQSGDGGDEAENGHARRLALLDHVRDLGQ